MKSVLILFSISLFVSCSNSSQKTIEQESAQGEWIVGNEQEKLELIESQLRGFDKTMVEVGYRYQELYWGGQDQNWEYAIYQLKKIEKSIRQGLVRRPKRAESAQYFLNEVIPEVQSAIDAKDTLLFNQSFEVMRTNCNNCHVMEKVPTFTVQIPTFRQSPIGNF